MTELTSTWNEPVSSAEGKHVRSLICELDVRALINMHSHTYTYSGGASVVTNCYPLFGGTYCETPTGEFDVSVAFIQQTGAK